MSEGIVKINKQGFFQINDLEFGKETLVMKYNMLLRENTKLKTQLKEAEKVIDYYSNWNKLVRDSEGATAIDTILASSKAKEYKTKFNNADNETR